MTEVRTYRVELSTLLGKRGGQLRLFLSDGRLSGVLRLMKAEPPVQGYVLADETCSLKGSVCTRVGVYPFEGEGLLSPEHIEIQMRVKGVTLPLRGTREEE